LAERRNLLDQCGVRGSKGVAISDEQATSPIILSHRLNDDSWYIPALKELIAEMYAQSPPWLDVGTNVFPEAALAGTQRDEISRGSKSRKRASKASRKS